MRTENLAIVFIDIAGFTPRTSSQTREENLQMLRRFDGIVRPLVRCYAGRVVKTIGDAYLLTFRSPTDALLCSMAIHDRITETDASVDPQDRFTIRAAVNVGEVRIESSGDVFGEAVNIASRIEGKAGAGEIYFSESVYLSMTRTEVPSEEVGYTELKGISGKVRLYRVPRADEAGGYALKQRGGLSGTAPAGGEGGPAAAALPFGGHGLDRVRDKLAAGPALTLDHVQGLVSKTPGVLRNAADASRQGFRWWRTEVRHSRPVQYATIAVIIVLIIALGWGLWHYTHRPKTPWQKFQRSLGF